MQRSLTNYSEDGLAGFPITTASPVNGNILIFDSLTGQWIYGTIASSSDINNVINVGSTTSLINGIVSNTLYLKGILAGSNLTANSLINDVQLSLNSTLNNIVAINNGLSYVQIPLIEAQNAKFTNISAGTLAKNLCLDINNNLIYDNNATSDITGGQNVFSGPFGFKEIFKQVVGTTMQFRTITIDSNNLTIQTIADSTHAIGMSEFIRIQGINTSNINDTLTLGADIYFQDLLAGPSAGNYSIFIDNTNKIYKSYALASYSFLGLGGQIVNSQNNSDLIFKTLIGGDNITMVETPSTITFDLDSGLQNITSINTAGDNLNINGNVFLPNAPTGTYNKALFLDSSNKIISGDTINIIQSSGAGASIINTQINDTLLLKSLEGGNNIDMTVLSNKISFSMTPDIYNVDSINRTVFSLNTPTLNLSASVFNTPNIPTGTESYYLALDSGNNVVKVLASGANTNIYNSNGQLTTGDRVIQGFNIGGYNRIIYDNVNFSFQNNIRYAPDNLLLLNSDDVFYTADYGGINSRAMWSPYNYTSQYFEVSGLGNYLNFYYFYENILPLSGVDSSYFLTVDIYELTFSNNGFIGSYDVLINFNTISFGTVYRVQNNKTNLVSTGAANYNVLDLLFYTSIGGKLNIGCAQISTVPTAGTYKVFVKDYSAKGYKTAQIITSTGTLGALNQNTYFPSLSNGMSSFTGNGTPPAMIFVYNLYKDLIITACFDYFTNANITAFNFSVNLNGLPIITKLITMPNNGRGTLWTRRRLNVNQLLNGGTLLFGNNTLSFTFSPNMLFTNKTYEVSIEFV